MRVNLDLDLLRTFVHIAESGSFTRAATIVGRTQSAVSMQMQRLESVTERRLLERAKGGSVSLTSHGSHLLDRAKQLLELNDRLMGELHGATPPSPMPDEYSVPIRAQRQSFTNQMMMTLLTNEQFTRAYALVMRTVEQESRIDPATLTRDDEELVMAMLSMLEYVAINFLANTIDRAMLLRQRRSGLLKVHEVLADYIQHKRTIWQRPNVYRSFEAMVTGYCTPDEVAVSGPAESPGDGGRAAPA